MLVLGMGTPSMSQLDLMASAHVEHVVHDVGGGNVVGDHFHAVGAVRSRSLLDVDAVEHDGRRDALGRGFDGNL